MKLFFLLYIIHLFYNIVHLEVQSSIKITILTPSFSMLNKGNEGYLKVKVTNLDDTFATSAKVFLVSAKLLPDKKISILNNQELQPVSKEEKNMEYQVNFMGAKPDPGFYELQIRVLPQDKQYKNIESSIHKIKVVTQAILQDCEIIVADSTDSHDILDGHKESCSNKLPINIEPYQHLYINFKIQNQATNKPMIVQQAFIKLTNSQNKQEMILVAQPTGKQYSLHINISEISSDFFGLSGKYELDLIIGDSLISNSFIQNLSPLMIKFPQDKKYPTPKSLFSKKPEIEHLFRKPEPRPPKTISFIFTLAVLSPFLIFLVGLVKVGANLKNFPLNGIHFFYALGFQFCIGSILFLFAIYWFKLNMMQTLSYLSLLCIPTLFFAHKTLNYLASLSFTTTKTD